MPQLDILGYSAELFWVVLAFGALYTYSLCFVLPRIAQNLLYRQITFNKLIVYKKTVNKSEAPRLAASIENTFGNVAIDMINIRKTIDLQTSFVYKIVDSLEESVMHKNLLKIKTKKIMNSKNIYFALIGYLILSSLLYKVNEDVLIFFTAMILLGGVYSMIGSSVSEMLDSRAIAVSKRLDLLTSERQKLLSSLLNRSLLNAHVVERAYIMTVYSAAEILSTQDMHNEHLLIRINSYFEDIASFFMANKVSATESIFINNLIKFTGSINTLSPVFNKDTKN